MKTNDPEYLRAEDLLKGGVWSEYTLTIAEVIPAGTVKASDGTLIDNPIVRFDKAQKRFIVGKTNRRLMKFATGSGVESEWIGKTITLAAFIGDWFGQSNVAALRVKLDPKRAKPFITKKNMGTCLTGTKTEVTSAAN